MIVSVDVDDDMAKDVGCNGDSGDDNNDSYVLAGQLNLDIYLWCVVADLTIILPM